MGESSKLEAERKKLEAQSSKLEAERKKLKAESSKEERYKLGRVLIEKRSLRSPSVRQPTDDLLNNIP